MRILDCFNVSEIQSFGFVDSFDIAMIWSWGSLIRLVRTDTSSRLLWCLGDSVFWVHWFILRRNDLILRFVNLSNLCANVVIDLPEDPSKGCDLQGSFAHDFNVLIGPSCASVFWVLSRYYFNIFHMIHHPTLTLDRILLRNTIIWCSNITVQYDLSMCS